MLLNALFFQGRWKEPFDKSKTVPGQFRNADGTVSTVDMMNGEMTASCAENERATVAFLNYGNSGYYMRLIVPRDGYTLKDMTEEEIFGCIKGMDTYDLKVSMPRFSVTADYKDIAERITAMGYNRVFTDANYARIFGAAGTAVNGIKVFQKSRIEVDESGTRAAAVTGSGAVAGWNSVSRITVDRPFMFTINESSTGVVLFMGKVAKL